MFNSRFSKQPTNQARFCVSTLNQPANSNEDLSQEQLCRKQDGQEAGSQSVSEPSQMNPAVEKIKEMATSRLFLAAIIGYTIIVILSLIMSVVYSNVADSDFALDTGLMLGANAELSFNKDIFLKHLVGDLPSILLLIGLWMFYKSSRHPDDCSANGLFLIQVSAIATFVMEFFLSVFMFFLFLSVVLESPFNMETLTGILIYGGLFFCPMVYSFMIVKTTRAVRYTLETGRVSSRYLGILGIMNYVFAGVSLLGIIRSFILANDTSFVQGADMIYNQGFLTRITILYTPDIVVILTSVISAGVLVLFGIMIFSYRKKIKPFSQCQKAAFHHPE